MNELKFTCPKCGFNALQSIENVTLVYDVIIYSNEDLSYKNERRGNGVNDKVSHYACGNCDFIVDDGGIDNPEDLIKWIIKNCS